jgi:hypothetical protein
MRQVVIQGPTDLQTVLSRKLSAMGVHVLTTGHKSATQITVSGHLTQDTPSMIDSSVPLTVTYTYSMCLTIHNTQVKRAPLNQCLSAAQTKTINANQIDALSQDAQIQNLLETQVLNEWITRMSSQSFFNYLQPSHPKKKNDMHT